MQKLIQMFNEKYGEELGIIDDSLSVSEIYKAYQLIAEICNGDDDIMERLGEVKLPEPKTPSEMLAKIELEKSMNGGNDNSGWIYIPHISTMGDSEINLRFENREDINMILQTGGKLHVLVTGWRDNINVDMTIMLGINYNSIDEVSGDNYIYSERYETINQYGGRLGLELNLVSYNPNDWGLGTFRIIAYTNDGDRDVNITNSLSVEDIYFEPIPDINL